MSLNKFWTRLSPSASENRSAPSAPSAPTDNTPQPLQERRRCRRSPTEVIVAAAAQGVIMLAGHQVPNQKLVHRSEQAKRC